MKILVRNISIGVIAGLLFNTTCSANPGILEVIEEPLAKLERRTAENSSDMQLFQQIKLRASEVVITPETSLSQFKEGLVFLCQPVAAVDYTNENIQQLRSALISNLHTIDSARVLDRDSYFLRIAEVSEKVRNAKEDTEIVAFRSVVNSLKTDSRYTELTTSNKDRFGLSRNIVLRQYGPSCSMNALFNFLRSCPEEEFAMIRSKCSPEVALALDNLLTRSGNSVALIESVNRLAPKGLWSMLLKKFGQTPLYGISYTVGSDNSIINGVAPWELRSLLLEFGLNLDVSSKKHYPTSEYRFSDEDIQKIVGDLSNGDYIVVLQTHYVFLKKTNNEISVYDSDEENGIEGELFGFSYFNYEAINYLVEIANYGEYQPMLQFFKITI